MTNRLFVQSYTCSVGELLIGSVNDRLCLMDFRYRRMRRAVDKRLLQFFNASYVFENSVTIQTAIDQLECYLHGELDAFDLPLAFAGTPFQQAVWNYLCHIPYGETRTYAQMAADLNRPTAIRAVGSANGANALSLIVPCHRVVASNGGLGGYAGGLAIKKRLLQLEARS